MIPTAGDTRFPWGNEQTPYLEMGGEVPVRALVEQFYDIIEEDSPALREMLPTNTRVTRDKFFEYLSGWLGGPPLYEEKRGHPRLRMRHMPFVIGDTEADEWMRCMTKAISIQELPTPLKIFLEMRFHELALHMRNQ
ncbi:MAG: group II truncated hemoglobin [Acidimicrobiia bacterium]